ncbi:MAG: NAD(P)/FAD-dependent oxidoreductase [Acidobacteriota bacterium]|nr:NAD(P)/FAD-dependent oxidoreductase [Acidobacteriota bacterium]
MTPHSVDVLVAGGGPGGLAAAESAARSGCSVLVLEAGKEIGSPTRTSGGSFIAELQALGIPEHLYHPIWRCRFLSPRNAARFDYDEPGACVIDVRGVFQHLAERAVDAGARIRVNTTALDPLLENGCVTGVTLKNSEAIRSRVLIDATGHRAALLKQAGVHAGHERFGVGSEYDMYAPHCDQAEAVFVVGSQVAPSGYAWVFPWGRHRVRVGVGIIHPDSADHPDAYLDRLVANAAQFGVDLRGAQPVEYHYGLIPSDGLPDCFVGDGILGAGDAAGQPSQLVGEGIRWAILAGKAAGTVAAQAVAAGDVSRKFLMRYQTQWEAEFGVNLRIGYEINKRIAGYSDAQWDEKVELLKMLTPEQFGRAMQTNFEAGWVAKLLWTHPSLLKHGFRMVAEKLGM